MKKLAVFVAIGLLSIALPGLSEAQPPPQAPESRAVQEDGIAGIYLCEGKNPDGSEYTMRVDVVRFGGAYGVRWTGENVQMVVGVGMLRGDTFSVAYLSDVPAIAVFKVNGDRLVGEWTLYGVPSGQVFPESWTKLKHPAVQPPASPPASQPEPRPHPDRQA